MASRGQDGRRRLIAIAIAAGSVVGGIAGYQGAPPVDGVLIAAWGAVFAVLASIDLGHRVIPNGIVYPPVVGALVLSPLWTDRGVTEALVGGMGMFGAGALVAGFSRGGLGAGDVKMLALVGLVAGHPAALGAALMIAISGGVAACGLLLAGKTTSTAHIAYAPFIALGGVAALVW